MGWGKKGLEGRITKGHKESFGNDGLGHYLDYSNGFTGIHMSKHQTAHLTNAEFILCQLDIYTAV